MLVLRTKSPTGMRASMIELLRHFSKIRVVCSKLVVDQWKHDLAQMGLPNEEAVGSVEDYLSGRFKVVDADLVIVETSRHTLMLPRNGPFQSLKRIHTNGEWKTLLSIVSEHARTDCFTVLIIE